MSGLLASALSLSARWTYNAFCRWSESAEYSQLLTIWQRTWRQRTAIPPSRVCYDGTLHDFHLLSTHMHDRHKDVEIFDTFSKAMDVIFSDRITTSIGASSDGKWEMMKKTKAWWRGSSEYPVESSACLVRRPPAGLLQASVLFSRFWRALFDLYVCSSVSASPTELFLAERSRWSLIWATQWHNMRKVTTLFENHSLAVVAYPESKSPICKPYETWWIQLLVFQEIAYIAAIGRKSPRRHSTLLRN